jgi:hypothetical protein
MEGSIGTIIGVILSLITILGGFWKIAKGFRDDLKKTTDLLFQRFDTHKEAVDKKLFYLAEINDKKYTKLEICNVVRENTDKVLSDINRKLDLLLEERRNK